MYKLIVSDFDNTLIDDFEEVPASTVVLFDKLRRSGVRIAIATGRSLKSVLDYNRDFTFCDYLITSNGAYIYDVVKEKVIYKKNIGVSKVKKIVKMYYDDAIIYLTDNNTWNLISDKSAYDIDYDVIKQDDYMNFINENKTNIYKMELYFNSLSKAKKALKEIKDSCVGVFANLQIHGDKYIVEVTDSSINKLVGVEKICSKLKISLDNVMAFGDGYNDIELLSNVECSVSVNNAVDELKKISKYETYDNNSKGVEKFIMKYLNK